MKLENLIQLLRLRAAYLQREADACYWDHNRERILHRAQGLIDFADEIEEANFHSIEQCLEWFNGF